MKRTLLLLLLTLLAASAAAQTFKVIHSFNFLDGDLPNGDLIGDSAGNFYGTTQLGGTSGLGIVFQLDPKDEETVLYSFTGALDGGMPIGGLVRDAAGNLYGVTSSGGDSACSCGTVFRLAPDGTLTTLHRFKGGKDGAQNEGQPELGLVLIKGDLYGAASFGGITGCDGNLGCGVIFKVTPTGKETVLYRFTGRADGAFPQDLTSDNAGNLYASTGGSYTQGNNGTVFKMDTTGKLTGLYTFPGGSLGDSPRWRLVHEASGIIHGVTVFGGFTCSFTSAGCGVVFTLDATGKERVLHAFGKQFRDGAEPSGRLVDVKGILYGMTFFGGITNSTCTFGCGVIYRVRGRSGKFTVLYRFTGGNDGWAPSGGLTEDAAGNLYGTAKIGGSHGDGVIFKVTP
jgi:uncharacterized repeat protein (TIGR03803 family)